MRVRGSAEQGKWTSDVRWQCAKFPSGDLCDFCDIVRMPYFFPTRMLHFISQPKERITVHSIVRIALIPALMTTALWAGGCASVKDVQAAQAAADAANAAATAAASRADAAFNAAQAAGHQADQANVAANQAEMAAGAAQQAAQTATASAQQATNEVQAAEQR